MLDVEADLYTSVNEDIIDAVLLADYPYVVVGTKSNKLVLFKNFKYVST